MSGPPRPAQSTLFWKLAQIPTLAVSNGRVMEPMSVLVWAREKFKSGMLKKEPSSEACMDMTLVLASWVGTNTPCQPVHDLASSSTMMSVSPSTRSPNSFLTPLRSVASSGELMELNLQLAEMTTSSLSGTLVPWLCPSSPRPTTRLQSRLSAGAHGSQTSSLLVVDHTTVISTSGTLPLGHE